MSYEKVLMKDTKTYVENGLDRYINLLQGGNKDVLKHLIQLWNDYCKSVGHMEDSVFDMTNEEDRILIAKMSYNVNLCVYAHCLKTQNPYFIFEDNSDNNCVIKAIYKENIIDQIKCFGEEIMIFMLNYPRDFDCDAYACMTEEMFCDIGFTI